MISTFNGSLTTEDYEKHFSGCDTKKKILIRMKELHGENHPWLNDEPYDKLTKAQCRQVAVASAGRSHPSKARKGSI